MVIGTHGIRLAKGVWVQVVAYFLAGLRDFRLQRIGIRPRVVTDAGNLPRNFRSGLAAGDAELVAGNLLRDVEIRPRRADGSELVAEIPVEGLEIIRQWDGRLAAAVELDHAVRSEDSRQANFTNEGGVDDRIRYLRNVMGLWLLQESLRAWDLQGMAEHLPALLIAAAELPEGGPVFDPDDPGFLAPGDMPERIAAACRSLDQPVPANRPALVRSILDSLAAAYGRAVRDAIRLSGSTVKVVHLVGGGARNALLCQLTADACEVPVLAGPVEATALGNVLIQARARGLIAGDLEALRGLVRATQDIRRYEPRPMSARQRA